MGGRLIWLLAVAVLATEPAWALTTQQVLELKRAGVNEETIRRMIDNEMAQSGQGRLGRYVLRQSGGGEVVVYQATSPGGVQEYPLDLDPGWLGSERIRMLLGVKPGQDIVVGEKRAVSQAQPAGEGRTRSQGPAKKKRGDYTLLLESHRQLGQAQKRVKDLNAEGIDAKVESVDMGQEGRWYRVLHGNFAQRGEAEAKGEKLREVGGIDSFTVLGR